MKLLHFADLHLDERTFLLDNDDEIESLSELGEFLPAVPAQPECRAETIVLSAEARHRKRRMFTCFETQQHMLASFPIAIERFRLAPHYDFTRPPHPGRLFYEDQDWGLEGIEWRRLAGATLEELFSNTADAAEYTPEPTATNS